jgi:rsbT co-antagonist protein RsbR
LSQATASTPGATPAPSTPAYALAEVPIDVYTHILGNIPLGLLVYQMLDRGDPHSFRLVAANAQAAMFARVATLQDKLGLLIEEIFPQIELDEVLSVYASVVRNQQAFHFPDTRMQTAIIAMKAFPLPNDHVLVEFENVTLRREAEAALLQAKEQEGVIKAQQQLLTELNSPLLAISDNVVVMPLIGSIDSRRAQHIMDELLQGISSSRARVAILDVTGVPIVDTQVASALIQTSQAVQLLGAQVIITGIRPEMAQTLTGLGVNLGQIVTLNTLQSGIQYALQR